MIKLVLLLALLAMPTSRAFSQRRGEVLYDGLDELTSMQRQVRDVVEVSRTPLFDNAPFLRLRKGDKLVKAKEALSLGKPNSDPDKICFYLFSGDKYYQLRTEKEGGKLLLSPSFYSANSCLCFDWDLTLANARALRHLLPNDYPVSLTKEQYNAVLVAIRGEFPGIEISHEAYQPDLQPEHVVSVLGHTFVEFKGLTYDAFRNVIYDYLVRLGPSVCSIDGEVLLRGPRRVDSWEFERVDTDGPNGTSGQDVDPKVAKIKRAEYDEMMRFQKVVTEAIQSETPHR